MALRYAEELSGAGNSRSLHIPIAMGGTLNQDIEGESAPVDVQCALRDIGIHVCKKITDITDFLQLIDR